ncbi:hypothetical protein V2O64_07920 [Verrucomicrobiaceae bacterium 227]
MKSKIVATILTVLSSLSAFAQKPAQPLIIETPETWKVEFEGKKNMQFYTVTLKEEGSALLMLSRWSVPGTSSEIPKLVASLKDAFLEQVKGNEQLKITSTKHEVKKIKGDTFSGNFVKFKIKGGIVQTMFMIGQKKDLWNGQFTGTEKQWSEALAIIQKIKKKGE